MNIFITSALMSVFFVFLQIAYSGNDIKPNGIHNTVKLINATVFIMLILYVFSPIFV